MLLCRLLNLLALADQEQSLASPKPNPLKRRVMILMSYQAQATKPQAQRQSNRDIFLQLWCSVQRHVVGRSSCVSPSSLIFIRLRYTHLACTKTPPSLDSRANPQSPKSAVTMLSVSTTPQAVVACVAPRPLACPLGPRIYMPSLGVVGVDTPTCCAVACCCATISRA
jgi:hypothetical protein